jgi:hypothetical protein
MLERYRLGELSAEEIRQLESRARIDTSLQERLAALDQSDAETRRAYPPSELAADVRRRLQLPRSPRNRRLSLAAAWLVPVTVAVVVVIGVQVTSWRSSTSTAPGDDGEDRPKGAEAALYIYRDSAAGGQLLRDGDVAHVGEVIRVGYRVNAAAFGAIVSVDGRGVLTHHLPEEGNRSVALEAGTTVLLDRAFELDDAPRVERFFLVTAPMAFEVQPIADALAQAGSAGATNAAPVTLPPPFTLTSFPVWKDSRR